MNESVPAPLLLMVGALMAFAGYVLVYVLRGHWKLTFRKSLQNAIEDDWATQSILTKFIIKQMKEDWQVKQAISAAISEDFQRGLEQERKKLNQ